MKPIVNPRKKKLEAIARKITLFIVGETFTDESEAQGKLASAIKILTDVADELAKNDELAANATEEKS